MRVLFVFFGLMLVSGTMAARRQRTNRVWPVLVLALVVTVAFLSQRAY